MTLRGSRVVYGSCHRAGAKRAALRLGCAGLALGALAYAAGPAEARTERSSEKARAAEPRTLDAEGPLLMQVSLNEQRLYVYDANGLVTQTRISSGRAGHETPKGIYSILEKKIDHTSNIYLDAKMPYMQRLTMTGIALHAGVVPGYPASGGCVRLPFDFARRFFGMTDINQRVVIAPDVQAPAELTHPLLFAALPSVADAGKRAQGQDGGTSVADTLLGVAPARAGTESQGRTLESAAEARRAERQGLVEAADAAAARRTAAAEGEKTATRTLADAKAAAKTARNAAYAATRTANKAKAALAAQERTLRKIAARLPEDISTIRADKLEALRAAEAEERARIAPATAEAERTAAAAESAREAAAAADAALAAATRALRDAKAEIKAAAAAETAAKKAVATFDRQEQNRALPVSVFVSSQTGLVQVRQGFEPILEAQAEIESPEAPLDTFVFSAVGWKDDSRTELRWTATEVNEHSTRFASLEGEDTASARKRKGAEPARQPPATDAAKAARTLDRIKLPQEVSDRIAEVVKPGSTLIVSSYDVARSETKYAGTDFIVQMPEVVAKITRPTPRPQPIEVVEDEGGCFFFCSSYSSGKARYKDRDRDRKRQRTTGGKSSVW